MWSSTVSARRAPRFRCWRQTMTGRSMRPAAMLPTMRRPWSCRTLPGRVTTRFRSGLSTDTRRYSWKQTLNYATRGPGCPSLVVVPVGVGSLAQSCVAHYRNTAVEGRLAYCPRNPRRRRVFYAACVRRAAVGRHRRQYYEWAELRHPVAAGLALSSRRSGRGGRGHRPVVSYGDDPAGRAWCQIGPSGAATYGALREVLLGSGGAHRRHGLHLRRDAVLVCFFNRRAG